MPVRERNPLFRESLNPLPPRRLGRGVAISLMVHLMVLWGFQRLTSLPPSGDGSAARTGEIRVSGSSKRPHSPSFQSLEKGPPSKRGQRKPRPGRIGGRLAVGGAAAAGFRVEARRAGGEAVTDSAILDPAGNFMLGLLPAGVYEFSLWHEDRLISRIRARIRSGTFLDLEWTADLNARLRSGDGAKSHPPDPRAFWNLFRDPANRKWRDNMESMLSRAGVSDEARFARRRAEDLWDLCRRTVVSLVRSLQAILDRMTAWGTAAFPAEILVSIRSGTVRSYVAAGPGSPDSRNG